MTKLLLLYHIRIMHELKFDQGSSCEKKMPLYEDRGYRVGHVCTHPCNIPFAPSSAPQRSYVHHMDIYMICRIAPSYIRARNKENAWKQTINKVLLVQPLFRNARTKHRIRSSSSAAGATQNRLDYTSNAFNMTAHTQG